MGLHPPQRGADPLPLVRVCRPGTPCTPSPTSSACPELDDFADIMRLSGEEGASVYANLRARSAAMRTAMLNDELAEANAVGERMSIPGSLLGVIFMALLVAPSLLRMFSNT